MWSGSAWLLSLIVCNCLAAAALDPGDKARVVLLALCFSVGVENFCFQNELGWLIKVNSEQAHVCVYVSRHKPFV